ncbi:MAG: alternative ribosome rescue aminoacyl-tRNA hydrolase ArfB [Bacteroidota bacterium]
MDKQQIESELNFRTARSSGSGGQHVNKVETKVELLFDVDASTGLSETEKKRIRSLLKKRINKDGQLRVVVQEKRSQHRNKELAITRFFELLKTALKKQKVRRYKPIRADREKRLKSKKRHSEKKAMRRKVDW